MSTHKSHYGVHFTFSQEAEDRYSEPSALISWTDNYGVDQMDRTRGISHGDLADVRPGQRVDLIFDNRGDVIEVISS